MSTTPSTDHFIANNGIEYSGSHLIIDLRCDARYLSGELSLKKTLKQCVAECHRADSYKSFGALKQAFNVDTLAVEKLLRGNMTQF